MARSGIPLLMWTMRTCVIVFPEHGEFAPAGAYIRLRFPPVNYNNSGRCTVNTNIAILGPLPTHILRIAPLSKT